MCIVVNRCNMEGSKPRGRPRKPIDVNDPDTWPRLEKRQHKREMYLKDVFLGHTTDKSPKSKYIDSQLQRMNDGLRVRIDPDMIEAIADIGAMHKIGMFRHLPDSVLEVLIRRTKNNLPFDPETVGDPNPSMRAWRHTAVIRMALEVMRLYLMAMDPYVREVVRSTLSADKHRQIGLREVAQSIERVCGLEAMIDYEDDDDFDFSSLEEVEF